MGSSAVTALKKALIIVAVCVNVLHSSMGQQPPATSPASTSPYTGQQPPPPPTPTPPPPPPASPGCPYTGQQPPPSPSPTPVVPPAPTPTPVPAPMPTPTPASPAPAPSPTSNCSYSDCASQCPPSCQAGYHPINCSALYENAFNGCYESCTNHTCPGKSCVHSVCGFNCSCDNPHASSCCESCRTGVYPAVASALQRCQSYNERYMGYCLTYCYERCSKNCTQQGA